MSKQQHSDSLPNWDLRTKRKTLKAEIFLCADNFLFTSRICSNHCGDTLISPSKHSQPIFDPSLISGVLEWQ